jgi:hypothetical protein
LVDNVGTLCDAIKVKTQREEDKSMPWMRLTIVEKKDLADMMTALNNAKPVIEDRGGYIRNSLKFFKNDKKQGGSMSLWETKDAAEKAGDHPDIKKLHKDDLGPKVKDGKIDVYIFEVI